MSNKLKGDASKIRAESGPGRIKTNRFPGIGERPVYGRDSLFLAQRLRQDYWKRHKERADLIIYKERLVANQRRAENVNEVRRVEGFLQSNLTYPARKDALAPRKTELLSQLGMGGVP
jgi:hypothetical protein